TATATVLYGHELGLVPITTPAYSPESNGLAEAFVGTFKRDYVSGAELRDAETVLAQLGGWFDDYNTQAPHSALGMRSPAEYRAEQLTLSHYGSVSKPCPRGLRHVLRDRRMRRAAMGSGFRGRPRALLQVSPQSRVLTR